MTEPRRIAVVGAGNGAHAMAGHLAVEGHTVRLFSVFPHEIEAMQRAGGVHLEGELQGFGKLDVVSTDPTQTVAWADVVMVVVPAFAHRSLAELLAPHLRDGQTILLNPGRTGGALEFSAALKRQAVEADVIVGEAQTLIYACRISGPATVKVFGIKKEVPIAALPASRNQELLDQVQPLLPEFSMAKNVLETSLDNIGAVFHPATVILNANRIEAGDPFEFYRGMTPTVTKVLEGVDRERVTVAREYGCRTLSAGDWLTMAYDGIRGNSLYERIQSNSAYAGIMAPTRLDVRYLTEDIPTGLVPVVAFGEAAGVRTPICQSVVGLACSLLEQDFVQDGRNLKNLGLDGMDRRGILDHIESGNGHL